MRVVGIVVSLFIVGMTLFNLAAYACRTCVLRRLAKCAAADRLGWIDWACCFAQECGANAFVVLAAPLGWIIGRQPETSPSADERQSMSKRRGPVVLVHGMGVNGGSMLLLRQRLLRDGWGPVCCFNYLSHAADVETAAAELRTYVERVAATSTEPVTLIGHSLGGLVIRYYARHFPSPRVRRLLTLGTPHRGTILARRWLPALAPGSKLLVALNAADRPPQQFDVITIYSSFDALILPPANAVYDNAFNIQLNNVGHNALLTSKRVYGLIAENLAAPLP